MMKNKYKRGVDSLVFLEESKEYTVTTSKVAAMCRALTLPMETYNPEMSATYIGAIINSKDFIGRVFYSDISAHIYGLDNYEKECFSSNIEYLMRFTLHENNAIADETKEFILKLYDHSQLALAQKDKMEEVFEERVAETRDNISVEVKRLEREYITILGIFAAIVLAFVGGMTFSSSVLEHMSTVTPFRLLFVISSLGILLVNLIALLCKFITNINEVDFHIPFKWINIVMGGCVVIGFGGMLLFE